MLQILARNMRHFREESGKTMTALCESVGMSRAFWTDLEKGNRDPSTSTLEKVAQALGVTVSDLITERPKSKRKELAGARG